MVFRKLFINQFVNFDLNINDKKMKALFSDRNVEEHWDAVASAIDREISKLPKNAFEKSTIDELALQFMERSPILIPKLLEDKIYTKKPQDTKIPIGRSVYGGKTIDGTRFTFVIPFDGDSYFFGLRPSKYMGVFPLAELSGNELLVTVSVPVGGDTTGIRGEFDKSLEMIKTYLSFLDNDAKIFSNKLPSGIKISLQNRKNKLDNDDEVANSFGFPIR